MAEDPTVFLVNPYQDPVVMRIKGKASFQNSGPVSVFFERLIEQGRRTFVIDFDDCTGMDSTFLGILAGIGLELMRNENRGSIILARLGQRNMELVRNLGLHRILLIDDGKAIDEQLAKMPTEKLNTGPRKKSEMENARMVLQAHENLVEVDASNETKFQDVISFLKNQIDEES